MPVYTYRCESCGVQFERTQKFSDQPLTRCPECGKKSLRKVYTPVGIVFKGSGFYSTDHKSPSGAPRPGNTHSSSESEKGGHEHETKTTSEKSSAEKGSSEGASSSSSSTASSSTSSGE
jgi:putative FmdB family regulatory protein